MPHAIPIRLTGRELPGHPKPALLGSFSRSSGAPAADDGFLPSAYIKVETSFDVGMVARSAAGAQVLDQPVGPDEVLVIELADGSTLVTSAGRLLAALEHNRPDLISADGAILFDRLRDEGPATRGFISDAVGGLVSNVFRLSVGAGGAQDAIIDSAQDKLVELLGDKAQQLLGDKPELGVSWLGTKALMWAIEEKLGRPPGKLYQWTGATAQGGTGELADVAQLEDAARQQRPMLVFIHGTGSSTLGSFGDLQRTDSAFWAALKAVYPDGVYGFEHRSLSESPIQNALQLVEALPKGARVSLVTHSRGGLVGDLLCLSDIDAALGAQRFQ